MQIAVCKMSGVQANFTESDADHEQSAVLTEFDGVELDSVNNGTVTGTIPNNESKDAYVKQRRKSLSTDRESKPRLSATSLRRVRVQVAALVAVVIVVWGLLALPIVFYYIPEVSLLQVHW